MLNGNKFLVMNHLQSKLGKINSYRRKIGFIRKLFFFYQNKLVSFIINLKKKTAASRIVTIFSSARNWTYLPFEKKKKKCFFLSNLISITSSSREEQQQLKNTCCCSFALSLSFGSSSRCCKFQLDYYFSCLKNFFADYFATCFKNA
jgi:hypothetical protein